jgi:L-ascorbate metabolism protein UlaG (beta-lactamase superfamily)
MKEEEIMSTLQLENIHWLGHDSFRIEGGGVVIYIDPWHLGEDPQPADLILITHDHQDHCSPADVVKIRGEDTVIVTIKAAAAKLPGEVVVVQPGDTLTEKGILIDVVPAYNLNKFRSPGLPFHPKKMGHAGYILTVDGERIYHAGDTDLIPEMSEFKVDIALLPVSGKYVMTAEEAAKAAQVIQPQVVIPMHVGRGIGSLADLETFQAQCPLPVEILPQEAG